MEEKKEAKRVYDEAVSSGLGAAHVAADTRDSNRFTVSMNVEPFDKVIFNLTYEQLLNRKHGKYEMAINLHPGQYVKDLSVDVYINETRRLKDVTAPALRSGNEISDNKKSNNFFTYFLFLFVILSFFSRVGNEFAEIKVINDDHTEARIHFAPTVEQQRAMAKELQKDQDDKNGLSGQFIVEYDVERDPSGGEVLVSYFFLCLKVREEFLMAIDCPRRSIKIQTRIFLGDFWKINRLYRIVIKFRSDCSLIESNRSET